MYLFRMKIHESTRSSVKVTIPFVHVRSDIGTNAFNKTPRS